MDFHLSEWLNLVARWVHVFAGILWVGQTYYFTWLDGRLNEEENVWMVHSGGFYSVEKKPSPKIDPARLHWFRWEAALTWLSGAVLLVLVYYHGGMMVDADVADISAGRAAIIGVAAIALAWVVYDLLWLSPLGKSETLGAVISFVLLVGASYALVHLLSGRAAYMHIGAMMGTIMAANVWMRILPAQRRLVAALAAGTPPDVALAARAKSRSKHNTFMAVPVVLIMISNHFPTATYGSRYNWIVLSVLVLLGWAAAKLIRRA